MNFDLATSALMNLQPEYEVLIRIKHRTNPIVAKRRTIKVNAGCLLIRWGVADISLSFDRIETIYARDLESLPEDYAGPDFAKDKPEAQMA